MKCPERYFITQHIIDNRIISGDEQDVGGVRLFFEGQRFGKCYEEECAAWDKKKKRCMKFGKK